MRFYICLFLVVCSTTLVTGFGDFFNQMAGMAQGMMQKIPEFMQNNPLADHMKQMQEMMKNGGGDMIKSIQEKMGEMVETASKMSGEAPKKMQELMKEGMEKISQMQSEGTAAPEKVKELFENMMKQMNG